MHIRWRGLELPSAVTCEAATLTSTYGKFIAEPFERGFGSTIGNGLRRVLLSSLEGSAVTQIKVHNAQHEFTTIKGVFEDVTDIVLNVKSLVVKNHSDTTRVLRVEKNTAGPILASDIETDEAVEVLNPDHVLATLTDNVPFVMEMVVENGRGYVPASEHSQNIQEIGIIPDRRRVQPGGPRAVRNRGNARRPEDELRQAHDRNLDERLGGAGNGAGRSGQDSPQAPQSVRAIHRARPAGPLAGPRHARPSIDAGLDAKLGMSLAELNLSVRASNCLESENIMTVRDLVTRSEDQLLEVRNFGETTLTEVRNKLRDLGLHLGMRLPPVPAGV